MKHRGDVALTWAHPEHSENKDEGALKQTQIGRGNSALMKANRLVLSTLLGIAILIFSPSVGRPEGKAATRQSARAASTEKNSTKAAPADASATPSTASTQAEGTAPSTPSAPSTPAERKAAMVHSGPAAGTSMALTFDDGPHPKLTPRLLEILKKENAKATFFMLGEQVEKFPDIAKMVAEAGMEIGNHSFTHADLSKLSTEKIRDEVKRTQDVIEKATGQRPKLFRPPYGAVNDRVLQIAQEEGLTVVTWSIDPRDWDQKKSRESVKEKIIKDGAPGQIVCVHDIHQRTVDMVEEVMAALREKKLDFTTAGAIVDAEKEARLHRKTAGPGSSGHAAAAGNDANPQPILVPLDKSQWKKP